MFQLFQLFQIQLRYILEIQAMKFVVLLKRLKSYGSNSNLVQMKRNFFKIKNYDMMQRSMDSFWKVLH